MEKIKRQFGIIGLGKMGGHLAMQAMEKGYTVIGEDKSDLSPELRKTAIKHASNSKELMSDLEKPRVVFLYIPAGKVVDIVIDEISSIMDKGDIIVDGGNSYWGDSIRRAEKMKEKGIYFVDCGTSGGIEGARNGACFMVGGEHEAIEIIEPILKDLSVPGGYIHTGGSGSGHFVKLVHNGIEFGMLQAIGEGVDLLERFRDKLDIGNILNVWNHGSVIRSWLIELMEKEYKELSGLENVPSYIEDTGEVNWLVSDALRMEVPIPIISGSVMKLFDSRNKKNNWARAIAMMRHGFGGHPFGENSGIKHERKYGRVGGFIEDDKEEEI